MEESNTNPENEPIDLRIENELKKMKLSLEHGGTFFSSDDNELSPEMERNWLDRIQQFEKAYADCKQVSVYDFINRPLFKAVEEIPEADMEHELDEIMELIGRSGICLDTICPVDARELYRFITEELFNHEIDDMRVEGMIVCFIYEEFHPNHEYDITNHCKDVFETILNKNATIQPDYIPLSREIFFRNEIITRDEFIEKMELFRGAFSTLELNNFKITTISISENTDDAEVYFEIAFKGLAEGTLEKKSFWGIGNCELKNENDWWRISKINIPGISC